ncbi:polysaccharide pyruvyl transferase family protein [Aestuariibaculum sediminum]|uniref:Polysaccharide pyruvyl transferase family protein n=1 Tax=Aestuariibaculum sediminum TaxID=2770637 RepID=A0A8J6QA57_9FLAO|nr:polysaccharide pyruvyl transferase family protein [Aestuariibaculum sediminum]MBD0833097.1 polysaccharide pyruvyl transferase family protein [Aestuariibaculum sediminum]
MIFSKNRIRLFWWSEVFIQKKTKENFGDLLGKYLVEKITGKQVVFTRPDSISISNWFTPIYLTVGSILTYANTNCIVWGSGIISKAYNTKPAQFLAVRGPQTRKHLKTQGYDVPEIYGDPALLLPRFYAPEVKKKYKTGVVPHYNDYSKVKALFKGDTTIKVIDLMTNDIEATTNDIFECERIVSSSLHGIIVAHAYGIPAVWQKFSDDVFGDDIKYQDYFESVNLKPYKSNITNTTLNQAAIDNLFECYDVLPDARHIETMCNQLMAVCPFKA